MNKRNAGFTLIELMIVVAIIAIIVAIAIPKLMSARISANENAALATLRSIASAQHQMESACAIDTDADGGGEFAYFGELAGMSPMRKYGPPPVDAPVIGVAPIDLLDPPILPTSFGDVISNAAGDGIVQRQGYYFQIWLPDGAVIGSAEAGLGAGPGGANGGAPGATGFPDSDESEILWACYAWPVDAEKTGNRVFFINQEGDPIQHDNRAQNYEGLALTPGWNAAYNGGASMDGELGLTAMGFAAGDGFIWTMVGN
ncbi:MAG: prepilin-type N-terminal cleavage/methylation domain-containing protein [Planctomycetota bacterium]|nr:prepilin-type N-terminal cleavage/methylation domain-containing protein [Planctomycetota bacterium]